MSVRAKFTVGVVTPYPASAEQGVVVRMYPQYDQTIPEDRSYSKSTPGGYLEMYVTNPAAIAELTQGKVFYLDFTEVTA